MFPFTASTTPRRTLVTEVRAYLPGQSALRAGPEGSVADHTRMSEADGFISSIRAERFQIPICFILQRDMRA